VRQVIQAWGRKCAARLVRGVARRLLMSAHMMRRFATTAVFAVLACLAATATADPNYPSYGTYVYDSVDEVETYSNGIRITGVVTGQSGPSTNLYLYFSVTSASDAASAAARCDRFAMLAMSKPGKYRLTVNGGGGGSSFSTCKLSLRTP
jgi:hypothetical protein